MSEVTQILYQIDRGDPEATEQLLPLVYEELKKLAATKMLVERPNHTLQATALVHEAYLRLFAGFSVTEVGELLGMPRHVAYENWKYIRTWIAANYQA